MVEYKFILATPDQQKGHEGAVTQFINVKADTKDSARSYAKEKVARLLGRFRDLGTGIISFQILEAYTIDETINLFRNRAHATHKTQVCR